MRSALTTTAGASAPEGTAHSTQERIGSMKVRVWIPVDGHKNGGVEMEIELTPEQTQLVKGDAIHGYSTRSNASSQPLDEKP